MEATDNRQDNVPATQQKEKNVGKQKEQKLNQAIFIRYEKAKPDGHIETVMDSYRNRLGRIYEHYDMETGKFEFTFKNYSGETLFKSDDLVRLREQILSRKKEMMQEAYERRIVQKQQKEMTTVEKFRAQKQQKSASRQIEKGAESFVEKTLDESRGVLKTLHDFAGGEDREAEMQEIRARKQERSRGISR